MLQPMTSSFSFVRFEKIIEVRKSTRKVTYIRLKLKTNFFIHFVIIICTYKNQLF